MQNQNQLLLLEDVGKLGRKGDIVKAKPGFIRNFLLPQKKAVIATKATLRMREKLQQERARQAKEDKEQSEKLAQLIEGKVLETTVKVDSLGHLYGSVSSQDIVLLFEKEGLDVEKHHIVLPHPIKKLGKHRIELKLKEGVLTHVFLTVKGEGMKESSPTVEPDKQQPSEAS